MSVSCPSRWCYGPNPHSPHPNSNPYANPYPNPIASPTPNPNVSGMIVVLVLWRRLLLSNGWI